MAKRLLVAGVDRQVFEVRRDTLEPLHCSVYDAYIFTDPPADADVISADEWHRRRDLSEPSHE